MARQNQHIMCSFVSQVTSKFWFSILLDNFCLITFNITCDMSSSESSNSTTDEINISSDYLSFIFTPGFRASSRLIYTTEEKHLYKKHNSYNKWDVYRCYQHGCSARVVLQANKCRTKLNSPAHTHPNNEQLFRNFNSLNQLKSAAKENKTIPLKSLYDDHMAG